MAIDGLTTRKRADQSGQPVAGDQRAEGRYRTVLQVAKLETERGDELCILRNVSAGGLRADVYNDFTVGEPIRFELKTGRRVEGRVAWTNGTAIGVEFDRKVPILAYLAHQAIEELGRRIRAPRVRIGEHGSMRVDDRDITVEIVDASQAGMRVRTDHPFAQEDTCQITAGGLGQRGAIVRWCHDGEAGLQFKQPLSFQDFAAWRSRRNESGSVQ